jgi:hypothetical protein
MQEIKNQDDVKSSRQKLLNAAHLILENKIDIIEGCRIIRSLWRESGLPIDGSYYFFVAVDSETDTYITEEMRKLCSEKFLQEKDKEKEEYLRDTWPHIKEECQELLKSLT